MVTADEERSFQERSQTDSPRESSRLHPHDALPRRPSLWSSKADGALPLRTLALGPEVPDLAKIARDAWRRVLVATPEAKRIPAALHPYLDTEGRTAAYELVTSLPPSPTDRAREALHEGLRLEAPRAERKGWRQMTIRIPAQRYEDLAVAAELLGTRPAELARMFIVNGTRRALADQDAADSGG